MAEGTIDEFLCHFLNLDDSIVKLAHDSFPARLVSLVKHIKHVKFDRLDRLNSSLHALDNVINLLQGSCDS